MPLLVSGLWENGPPCPSTHLQRSHVIAITHRTGMIEPGDTVVRIGPEAQEQRGNGPRQGQIEE